MKCENCGKTTEELYREPIEPGKPADEAKSVCEDCHEKAQKKVAEKQKEDSVKTADK